MVTVEGAAAELDVDKGTIYRWLRSVFLVGEQLAPMPRGAGEVKTVPVSAVQYPPERRSTTALAGLCRATSA